MFGVFAARRRDAVAAFLIICRGRPRTCTGGLLELVDSQLAASETPFLFSIVPSHMYPVPDSEDCQSNRCRRRGIGAMLCGTCNGTWRAANQPSNSRSSWPDFPS